MLLLSLHDPKILPISIRGEHINQRGILQSLFDNFSQHIAVIGCDV